MSDLQRFVRRLAQSVAERDPAGLRAPMALAEVSERIMPYRACRRALDLESVEEYELLLLRLVGEEHRLAQVWPPEAAERCRLELSGSHPDLGLIRQLQDVTLQLNLAQLTEEDASASQNGVAPAPAEKASTPQPVPAVTMLTQPPVHAASAENDVVDHLELEDEAEEPPAPQAAPFPVPAAAPPREVPMSADSTPAPLECPHCAVPLPRGREIRFCPECGGNVRTRPCGSCGTELELSWRHCVMCGQPAGDASRFA